MFSEITDHLNVLPDVMLPVLDVVLFWLSSLRMVSLLQENNLECGKINIYLAYFQDSVDGNPTALYVYEPTSHTKMGLK